jgi:hypothetical protein
MPSCSTAAVMASDLRRVDSAILGEQGVEPGTGRPQCGRPDTGLLDEAVDLPALRGPEAFGERVPFRLDFAKPAAVPRGLVVLVLRESHPLGLAV